MKPKFPAKLNKLIHLESKDNRTSPPEDVLITEKELFEQLEEKKGTDLFLGHFTLDQITNVLRDTKLIESVTQKGFSNITFNMDTTDPYHNKISMYYDTIDSDHLLGELIISTGLYKPKKNFIPQFRLENISMLIIEWISMQNPRGSFTKERPKLPGQRHPGLGVGWKLVNILETLAKRMDKDGILNFPEFYHNAVFYSEIFMFYNPRMQGKLLAMNRDLKDFPIDQVSYAIYYDCLKNKRSKRTHKWIAEEQILPASEKMQKYFKSEQYKAMVLKSYKSNKYEVDWKKYKRIQKKLEKKRENLA